MVKFKVTTGQQEVIELAYEPTKTLFDYIDDLSELYGTTVIVTIVNLLIY